MKQLPNYAKSLLLHGAGTMGTFVQGYYFVEESLYARDAKELYGFCLWIDENIGGAGSATIDMLFSAFKNPSNMELQKQATELADQIRQIKSNLYA
jgi:hypothetical protein